jgi:hypothetical protein
MQPDLDQPGSLARVLRELPAAAAPPYTFAEYQRRARERTRPSRSVAGGRWLAAAAVGALAVVALSLRLHPHASVREPPLGDTTPLARAASPAPHAEIMERWLASLPREPGIVHVGTHQAVTGLEDRIAQVDDLLSAAGTQRQPPPQFIALQQERTRLIGALVQVRYAETLADESR